MNPDHPFGLHTVTPYLLVKDAMKQVEFLKEIFNAALRSDVRREADGRVGHTEVILGDSIIMIREAASDEEITVSSFYTYVEDCDATYQAALDYGAKSIVAPVDLPHGDRYSGVKDQEGNVWWIVTHIAS